MSVGSKSNAHALDVQLMAGGWLGAIWDSVA